MHMFFVFVLVLFCLFFFFRMFLLAKATKLNALQTGESVSILNASILIS